MRSREGALGFGAPIAPMSWRMVCFTAGGSPTRRGQYYPLHGSGSSVASAGQLTTRATSMGCADIAYMRGASSPSNAHTVWRRVPSALRTPLTSRGKVSFFYVLSISCKYWCLLTECQTIINMGMPHLNPLEQERLAYLLTWS